MWVRSVNLLPLQAEARIRPHAGPYVGFAMEIVAVGQVVFRILHFPLSGLLANTPHPFTHLQYTLCNFSNEKSRSVSAGPYIEFLCMAIRNILLDYRFPKRIYMAVLALTVNIHSKVISLVNTELCDVNDTCTSCLGRYSHPLYNSLRKI